MRAVSLDHLSGAGEQRRRNFDAERPRGRKVDQPSRKARSTRALLILFGTPCLRAFTDVCGFAMASLCTLQSRPEFIGFGTKVVKRLAAKYVRSGMSEAGSNTSLRRR